MDKIKISFWCVSSCNLLLKLPQVFISSLVIPHVFNLHGHARSKKNTFMTFMWRLRAWYSLRRIWIVQRIEKELQACICWAQTMQLWTKNDIMNQSYSHLFFWGGGGAFFTLTKRSHDFPSLLPSYTKNYKFQVEISKRVHHSYKRW